MPNHPVIIAPSLLAANFLNLEKDINIVNNSAAGWLHLDVMDGRFVPNISFGMPVIEQVKKICTKPLDLHLMIVEPEKYIDTFYKLGVNHINIHYEACVNLHRHIEHIKSLGLKAGVAINPHTPAILLHDIIQYLDIVLVMSVNPGFGGQEFIPHTLQKIKELKELINQKNASAIIEIDGGVTLDNAADIINAGADALVAGNTVFKSADPAKVIQQLKNIG